MRRALWIAVLTTALVAALLATVGCEEWYKAGEPPEDATTVSIPPRLPASTGMESAAVESEITAESAAIEGESAPTESEAESEPAAESDATTESDVAAESELPAESEEAEVESASAEDDVAAESEETEVARAEEGDEPAAEEEQAEGGVTLTQVVAMNVKQAAVDCRVVRSHIEAAQVLLADREDAEARVLIQQAVRSAAFVRAGLPSVQAEQCIERALQEAERGQVSAATDAIEAAVDAAAEITLRGTVAEFRRRGTQAIEQVRDGDPARARELLGRMQDMIVPSESEYTASRISDHLMGALSALDRDAVRPAVAELTDADEKAFSLTRILEGVD